MQLNDVCKETELREQKKIRAMFVNHSVLILIFWINYVEHTNTIWWNCKHTKSNAAPHELRANTVFKTKCIKTWSEILYVKGICALQLGYFLDNGKHLTISSLWQITWNQATWITSHICSTSSKTNFTFFTVLLILSFLWLNWH